MFLTTVCWLAVPIWAKTTLLTGKNFFLGCNVDPQDPTYFIFSQARSIHSYWRLCSPGDFLWRIGAKNFTVFASFEEGWKLSSVPWMERGTSCRRWLLEVQKGCEPKFGAIHWRLQKSAQNERSVHFPKQFRSTYCKINISLADAEMSSIFPSVLVGCNQKPLLFLSLQGIFYPLLLEWRVNLSAR